MTVQNQPMHPLEMEIAEFNDEKAAQEQEIADLKEALELLLSGVTEDG